MKLHLVVNIYGEIVDFDITSGNVADNNECIIRKLTRTISGKLFGDRGYILNKKLLADLLSKNIHVITRPRKNMQPLPLDAIDSILLKKRAVIESIIGVLKQTLGLEHTRHRSPYAFLAHIAATIISYFFRDKKPSIVSKEHALQTIA